MYLRLINFVNLISSASIDDVVISLKGKVHTSKRNGKHYMRLFDPHVKTDITKLNAKPHYNDIPKFIVDSAKDIVHNTWPMLKKGFDAPLEKYLGECTEDLINSITTTVPLDDFILLTGGAQTESELPVLAGSD